MSSKMLAVSDIFFTIQGEAEYTGHPSLFLRLQGCNVGCPWCDTKQTWNLDPAKVVPLESVLDKRKESDEYAVASSEDVLGAIKQYKPTRVVITGGEPCDQNIRPLAQELLKLGIAVSVETSGTSEINLPADAWVTVSPKINMKKPLLQASLDRANEIKMPVGKARDIELLEGLSLKEGVPVWLQPLSQNEAATSLCLQQAKEKGYRVSIQTHKYIGVK